MRFGPAAVVEPDSTPRGPSGGWVDLAGLSPAAPSAPPSCASAAARSEIRRTAGAAASDDGCARISCAARPQQPSIYLQGIGSAEIIDTVHAHRAPMAPVHTGV